MSGWNEPKLDELFAAYREALPDREPSAGFTPELWRRIDQRRRPTLAFGRFAKGFASAALAFCFATTAFNWYPSTNSVYTSTYVDVLDDEPRDLDGVLHVVESL
jgi:hypothetical protein